MVEGIHGYLVATYVCVYWYGKAASSRCSNINTLYFGTPFTSLWIWLRTVAPFSIHLLQPKRPFTALRLHTRSRLQSVKLVFHFPIKARAAPTCAACYSLFKRIQPHVTCYVSLRREVNKMEIHIHISHSHPTPKPPFRNYLLNII
jgi:hypothetical protein